MIICLIIAGIGLLGFIVTLIVDICFRIKYNHTGYYPYGQTVYEKRGYDYIFFIIYLPFAAVTILSGIITLAMFGANKWEIYDYTKQKTYIETVSGLDEEFITQTKEKYNKWLWEAQYNYQHCKWITFYTSEVMELEEIK